MSIWSDLNEEAERLAYAQGFWDGVFWPLTLIKTVVGTIKVWRSQRETERRYQEYLKTAPPPVQIEDPPMPPQGDTRWYTESKLPFILEILKGGKK